MSRAGRNLIWLLLSQLSTWIASLVSVVIVPERLGSTEFGAWSFASGFVMFFTLVAGLGTSTLLSREIARDESRVGELTWNAIVLKVVLAVIASASAVGLAYALGTRSTTLALVAIACIGMSAQLVGEVASGALGGLQRLGGLAAWTAAQVYVQTILGVLVLTLGWGVVPFAFVMTGASILPAGALLWMVRHHLTRPRHLDADVWRLLFTAGTPLMALQVFNVIYGTVNIPILNYVAGEDPVGWYAVALRWVGIPVFVATAVSAAYAPEFSKHGKSMTAHFAPLVNRAVHGVLLVTVPAAAGIGLIADDLIRFIYRGGEYDPSIAVIQILALQMPVTAMDTLLATALIASDRVNRYLFVAACAAALNPPMCLIAIPYTRDRFDNGAIGAAIVMVVTELGVMIGALALRSPGVVDASLVKRAARIVAATAVMSLAVIAVRHQHLALQILAGMITYPIASLALGAVSVSEVRDVVARIRRRQPTVATGDP